MPRKFKTHTEFFERCVKRCEPGDDEYNMMLMLNSIAESLAAIADLLEEEQKCHTTSKKDPQPLSSTRKLTTDGQEN